MFNLFGNLSSIFSFFISLITFILVFKISRNYKNKRALSFILSSLKNYNKRLEIGKDIPSDLYSRIKEDLNKIKFYKVLIFILNWRLKKFISEINNLREINDKNINIINKNLKLIIYELEGTPHDK